jgi:hypothetical protein
MSFGLMNAPAFFMNLMNNVFMDYLDKFVVVFIDDTLIYSQNEEEHMDHLKMVLQRLREHQLYAKWSKCDFWIDEVLFLGHIINKDGLVVDPKKVADILNCKASIDVRGIKSFIVAEPPKLLGPHAPALVSKTSDGYACAPDNLTGSVQVPQGPQINHLQPGPQD